MNYCGQHLAHRFGQNHAGLQTTKIIAPRSGSMIAGNCALAMQLPLVVAVTQRPTPSEGAVLSVTRPAGGQCALPHLQPSKWRPRAAPATHGLAPARTASAHPPLPRADEADVTLHLLSEFVGPGDRVLLMDDVLSTGKMAAALIGAPDPEPLSP